MTIRKRSNGGGDRRDDREGHASFNLGGRFADPAFAPHRTPAEETRQGSDGPDAVEPLALLPLRLEYRLVKKADLPEVKRAANPRCDAPAKSSERQRRAEQAHPREAQAVRERMRTAKPSLAGDEELWIRWYPDENFAETAVPGVSADERVEIDTLMARLQGRPWWDLTNPETSIAWQDFARTVGPDRAVHLMRGETDPSTARPQGRAGRIACLPRQVVVFALSGTEITRLGAGARIPPNPSEGAGEVSYTPAVVSAEGWLTNFRQAVSLGMGLVITGAEAIETAKTADWIVAIGLTGAGTEDLTALVTSRIASGGFGILPQDAPTNNTAGARSHLDDPRSDIPAFTKRKTALEAGGFRAAAPAAADLLAEAFDLDPAMLRRAADGDDQGFQDARAMMQVVGPALLDDALAGIEGLDEVEEEAFLDVLSACVARGALPALRLGEDAFGVLPVTDLATLDIDQERPATRAVEAFLKTYALAAKPILSAQADGRVPVIGIDDPRAGEKLEAILKTDRVSVRVDLGQAGAAETSGLGCGYVAGDGPRGKPAAYLDDLVTLALARLPDPDANDTSWPLLYRLARLSVARNTDLLVASDVLGLRHVSVGLLDHLTEEQRRQIAAMRAETRRATVRELAGDRRIEGMRQTGVDRMRRANDRFARAIAQLQRVAQRGDGEAQLEVLLMETLDLFQHRIDAVATGLAYLRLRRLRRLGQRGQQAGYYGLLGKLSVEVSAGQSDGYLQAPSAAQAMTAAVLRSAYLRHADTGAFHINLGSRRVRGALQLLGFLDKGHSLSEALGLTGERWLHRNARDALIASLRADYPIRDQSGDGSAARRLFDGVDFLAVAQATMSADLRALHGFLSDELDALSDLVMAEAAYHRALGAGEAANAWLRVLSGHPVPGEPEFIRARRSGQASTHRVSLVFDEAVGPVGRGPRSLGEPSLARLAEETLLSFRRARIRASIRNDHQGPEPAFDGFEDMQLWRDLGLSPLDLLIGGRDEIRVRACNLLQRRILDQTQGRVLVDSSLIVLDFGVGSPSVEHLVGIAETIAAPILSGRPLEPGDLNAAAPASAGPLAEADEIAMITSAVSSLATRARDLRATLGAETAKLEAALVAFDRDLEDVSLARAAGEGEAVLEACLRRADGSRAHLAGALALVAAFGEPAALRLFTLQEVLADREGFINRQRGLLGRLETRRGALAATLARQQSGFGTLGEAEALRDAYISALQGALDGDGMPILPPYPHGLPAATPSLEKGRRVNAVLKDWRAVRGRVEQALTAAAALTGFGAFAVKAEATVEAARAGDEIPDSVSPSSMHYGTLLARTVTLRGAGRIAGVVCDEWAEQRPSQTQNAAVAISYASPQTEPAHCILLCVAPTDEWKAWSELRAARLVADTIDWMKIRALSSDDRLTPAALMPRTNQVPVKGADGIPRLPRSEDGLQTLAGTRRAGSFIARHREADGTLAPQPARPNERSGYKKIRE
ncbi:MAG: hypothetical protein AAF503_03215 [Pseudomonadota bacterium]